MSEILSSRNFSLLCAILNGAFAVNSLLNGSIIFCLICTGFSLYCLNNYINR